MINPMRIKCVICKKEFDRPPQPDGRGHYGNRTCSSHCHGDWMIKLRKARRARKAISKYGSKEESR